MKETTQMTSINKSLYSIFIKPTGNNIGDTGAASLSDALKSNTTLTALDLNGEYERNETQMISVNKPLFHFHKINRQQDWRNRSNIIE